MGMKNFTYGRGDGGVLLMTMRGHQLSDTCTSETEIDASVQAVKDELDRIADEMKAALNCAVEVDG